MNQLPSNELIPTLPTSATPPAATLATQAAPAVADTGAATQTLAQSASDVVARYWAFLPCAGVGARAVDATRPAHVPKQYQQVVGWPLVLHTLAAFMAVKPLAGVVVGVSDGDDFLQRYARPGFTISPCGGPSRADTVTGGLRSLLAQGAQLHDWVLVHDAARCLIKPSQITQLMEECAGDAVGGLLALPLPDTLKAAATDAHGQSRVSATLPRVDKWLAQTPQMFRIGVLLDALAQCRDVTDEASAIESAGLQPRLVAGSSFNFKVTYPDDFALAEALLSQRMAAGDSMVAHFFDSAT
ncbi:MAG: 2-C-methyl-D-erythritol 4-phosphate cytidylyltransferase [Comamonas sp.]